MTIQIKPVYQYQSSCPHCGSVLKPLGTLWQGIHVCIESICTDCGAKIVDDLKIGHAVNHPFQVDLVEGVIFGKNEVSKEWLGNPLLQSLRNPQPEDVEFLVEVFKECNSVIILNCIDFLYGHCLLKLLNAQRHLEQHFEYGLVVIVPKFLRWLVPEGVAEVWTVDIPLKKGQCYYPSFNEHVHQESARFNEIYISEAYSHPSLFDITKFTGIPRYCFNQQDLKITFVWREDRLWCNFLLFRVLRKIKKLELVLYLQNWKVRNLFERLRNKIPAAKFVITGLGKNTDFPEWIEDLRVNQFDEKIEREVCKVYSESRLVIGVHGSSMLLPSGHAGMTINLMPEERWGNFAQDILYEESDPRLAAFRYRYLPLQTTTSELAHIASDMVLGYQSFSSHMTADRSI